MKVAEGFPTRILIVDDKVHVRESLRSLVSLESRLYEVHTAANGPEALAILDREPVDVVLCDQVLTPEMSGTAVTGAIKERHPGVRVVVFTGKDVPKDTKVDVLEAGALFFLNKPINEGELLHAISTINSMRRTEYLGKSFETLSRIAFSLQETFDFDQLAQRIVAGAHELGYARARLYLLDEKTQVLAGRAAYGMPQKFFDGTYEIPFHVHPVVAAIFEADRPTVWTDELIREKFGEKSGEPWLTDMDLHGIAWVDCPLVVGNRRIGTLAVDHRGQPDREATRDDLQILGVFAGLAAQALNNARFAREQEALARASFGYGTLVLNEAGVIEFCNHKAERLLRRARTRIQGQLLLDMVPEGFRDDLSDCIRAALSDRAEKSLDLDILRSDGVPVPVKMHLTPFRSEQMSRGVAVAIYGADELTSLIQSGRLMVLGQMVAGVAHEINNPLNNILPAVRDLASWLRRQEALSERSQTYLEIIERNGERIQRIVRQLREFARPREFRREPLSLNGVVREALTFLETRLRNRDIRLVLDLDPELPEILGEPTRLLQVLINLLVNAEEAMEGQEEPKEIHITSKAEPSGRVSLVLCDSGPGVPPEMRDVLFDPFFTTKGPSKGTGLGLSISKGIMDQHEGTIELVEPPDGRGACFRIEMKQAAADE